ncbi:MAG TPA: asparaginase domain-containing protein [Nitrososphaerales archaeon]|nr:asparaginase domain-containing protein [Nitrososphaerales archaeon]
MTERQKEKPRIAVFSGPNATVANSPPLVTSNKARLAGERRLEGRYDNLVPQLLYEPVTVKIKKFSAHPLEADSKEVYHEDGRDYYEVTLSPEDGPYLLPYMARRKVQGSKDGVPFEASDMWNPSLGFGGRQFFYPDASRIFDEIDRSTSGRGPDGEGSVLDKRADFDFVRVLPPGGFRSRGEIAGVHYFPYRPEPIAKIIRAGDLATAANIVQESLKKNDYCGGIWLDGSPQLEESLYWLNLLIDTKLPIVGVAAQRPHGEVSSDGDRNIIDAVDYIISGKGEDLGAVGVADQVIFASREFKKADARPGNYKATGGHGGILGSIKDGVSIWYRPAYKHTHKSEVNVSKLPSKHEFSDGTETKILDGTGRLIPQSIPRVRIVKYASYSQEDESGDPRGESDIMGWVQKAMIDQRSSEQAGRPKLHGLVFEGLSPYAVGGPAQLLALWFAAASGMPVVRVGRSDPGGKVITDPTDLTIEGSNLDSTKARLLLIAAMLKLGRLPSARDPSNPTIDERKAIVEKVAGFQAIFESH